MSARLAPRAARAPHAPRPPRPRRWLTIAVVAVVVLALGLAAAAVIVARLETGEWKVPDVDDLVRVVKGPSRDPSRTIFLERRPIELRPGRDDAAAGTSSVLAASRDTPAQLPGWRGSDRAWRRVVACVAALFEPFDVVVTDQRPPHRDFVLVAVGGRPRDLGVKSRHVGGLAPFSGAAIGKPVVFAFSAQLRNDVRAVCETIGMEVAHAYGLDHGYHCKDVMTYLRPCGAKRFVDKDVRCGETKPRACEGGAATQNSHRHLLRVLGARR